MATSLLTSKRPQQVDVNFVLKRIPDADWHQGVSTNGNLRFECMREGKKFVISFSDHLPLEHSKPTLQVFRSGVELDFKQNASLGRDILRIAKHLKSDRDFLKDKIVSYIMNPEKALDECESADSVVKNALAHGGTEYKIRTGVPDVRDLTHIKLICSILHNRGPANTLPNAAIVSGHSFEVTITCDQHSLLGKHKIASHKSPELAAIFSKVKAYHDKKPENAA